MLKRPVLYILWEAGKVKGQLEPELIMCQRQASTLLQRKHPRNRKGFTPDMIGMEHPLPKKEQFSDKAIQDCPLSFSPVASSSR